MARTLALVLGGVVILAGGVVAWQRSQMIAVRGQLAAQQAALAAEHERMDGLARLLGASALPGQAVSAPLRPGDPPAAAQAEEAAARREERRLILDQYQDVLATLNLPEATASRLQDLLADRIETVLDAEDAARRAGFAEGTAQSAQVVAQAISGLDHDIALLVGLDGLRRLDGTAPPAAAPAPAPAPVVNVFVQATPAAPAPVYADSSPEDAAADAPAYAGLSYYPAIAVFGYPIRPRIARGEPGRTHQPGVHPREGFIHLH